MLHLFLYGGNWGVTFQHEDVHKIEHQLNKDLANSCEWFIDSKSSIYHGEDKTKYILFSLKQELKNAEKF